MDSLQATALWNEHLRYRLVHQLGHWKFFETRIDVSPGLGGWKRGYMHRFRIPRTAVSISNLVQWHAVFLLPTVSKVWMEESPNCEMGGTVDACHMHRISASDSCGRRRNGGVLGASNGTGLSNQGLPAQLWRWTWQHW